MSQENTSDSVSQYQSDRPRSRWGCCLNVVAIGGLIVACLVVFGYQWAKREVRENALRMAGTDQATLDKWLDEPVNVPAEFWKVPPKHGNDFQQAFAKLADNLENDSNVTYIRLADEPGFMAMYISGTTTTLEKIEGHLDLDTTDTETITSFTAAMETYLPRYRDLLASPEYSFNSRKMISSRYSALGDQREIVMPLVSRVAVQAFEGETSAGLATMEMYVNMARMDMGITIPQFVAYEFNKAMHNLSSYTSSTEELRAMLNLMNVSRDKVVNRHDRVTFDDPEMPRLIAAMMEDGFIPRLPETRRECFGLVVQMPQYTRFLRKKGNPRMAEVESLNPFYNEFPVFKALNVFIGPLYGDMMAMVTHAHSYAEEQGTTDLTRRLGLQYDMLRLQLARRIAQLDGKAELTKPEDFVPEYMETFPEDSYATHSLPLNYDAAKKDFFSVGLDGAAGTSDDVYGGVNGEQLPDMLTPSSIERLEMFMY